MEMNNHIHTLLAWYKICDGGIGTNSIIPRTSLCVQNNKCGYSLIHDARKQVFFVLDK
jgi:hypothetical protein